MKRVVWILIVLLVTRSASADDAGMRLHFKKGVDLYDKHLYTEALAEFREAYKEKPVPIIKQNIALCLKGLGRNEEAASSFDEALAEGKDTIKEQTRAAMQRELADLEKVVGTLNLKVIATDDHRSLEDTVIVSIDGNALPKGATKRPIRVTPAIHVVTAHVDGLPDPPEKKLSFVAGQPVDAVFELGLQSGGLAVTVNVKTALIRIDGEEKGRGGWAGKVSAGRHHIEVVAADWATTALDVTVAPGTSVDFPIEMRRPSPTPDVYVAPPKPVEPPFKHFYAAVSGALDGENLRLSAVEGEVPEGKRRDFSGVAGAARLGYRFNRFLAVEGHFEIGSMKANYRIKSNDPLDSSTSITHWGVLPMLRFSSPGKVRFTAGAGVGAHGTSVKATVYQSSVLTTQERKGSGVSLGWMLDAGAQLELGPVFIEPLVFFELHGLAAVTEDSSGERMLQASPGARAGIRLGIGVPF